jgi:hypothetical protein
VRKIFFLAHIFCWPVRISFFSVRNKPHSPWAPRWSSSEISAAFTKHEPLLIVHPHKWIQWESACVPR